jgi:ubiquinone/menaquinone biosynthesis C-methylase UbiE
LKYVGARFVLRPLDHAHRSLNGLRTSWEAALTTYWDDKADHLAATRSLFHNVDYWRFLLRDVWRIDGAPVNVVDFGCGAGWGGMFLLPMLAPGSCYAGLDRSEPLLDEARRRFAAAGLRGEFTHAEATAAPFEDDSFDVAFAHTVLMHLPKPERALAEMIRVTKPGGLVVTVDASQNAINALIHIHETEEQEHIPLEFFQRKNAYVRRSTGVDRNIGMKTPVLMHKAGLKGVQARVSDAVRLSFPPLDTPEKQQVFDTICDGGLGAPADDAAFQQTLAGLVASGLGKEEAAAELRREVANDYRHRGRDYHIVQPGLMTISYGVVPEP